MLKILLFYIDEVHKYQNITFPVESNFCGDQQGFNDASASYELDGCVISITDDKYFVQNMSNKWYYFTASNVTKNRTLLEYCCRQANTETQECTTNCNDNPDPSASATPVIKLIARHNVVVLDPTSENEGIQLSLVIAFNF